MKQYLPLGLAAALMLGTSGAAFAADAGMNAETDMELETQFDAQVDDLGVEADPMATGAIGAEVRTYDALVTDLEAGVDTAVDLAAFGPGATIQCVNVSQLEGNMDNAAALDAALQDQDDQLAVLRGHAQVHTEFMAEAREVCAFPGLFAENIISIQSPADGQFVVYVDDRDPMLTGAIGAAADDFDYDGLVGSVQTGAGFAVDRTAFGPDATIRCIALSDLEGTVDGTAALEAALGAQHEQLAAFRADIEAQPEFMSELRASCPGFTDVTAEQVLSIHTGAGGDFVVYIDDRA